MNNQTSKENRSQKSLKITLRQDFYTDHIKKYSIVAILCTVILFFLIYSVLVTYWDKPKDQYFAGYRDGSIIQTIPVDKRYFFDSEVSSWASVVLMDLLTFDFLNYADNISQQSGHFSDNGLNSFITWFKKELLENIQNNRFVLSTHLCGVAEVVDRGLNNDKVYSWDLNIPVVMTFQNSLKKEILTAVVGLNLIRVPNTESFEGVNINDISFNKLGSATSQEGRKNCPTSPSYS